MQQGLTFVPQTLLLQDLRELQLYSHLHASSLYALQIVFCAQKYNFKLTGEPSPGSSPVTSLQTAGSADGGPQKHNTPGFFTHSFTCTTADI